MGIRSVFSVYICIAYLKSVSWPFIKVNSSLLLLFYYFYSTERRVSWSDLPRFRPPMSRLLTADCSRALQVMYVTHTLRAVDMIVNII